MSLRASAHTGVAIRIPYCTLITTIFKRRTDCHVERLPRNDIYIRKVPFSCINRYDLTCFTRIFYE